LPIDPEDRKGAIMISYETQRVFFDSIVKMYKDYLSLYKFFNHGSLEGCTGFAQFYWVHSYLYRHSDLAAQHGMER